MLASHAIVRGSTYQKGWLKFHKKRDFVRKSFGCQDLRVVIFCTWHDSWVKCGELRAECRIWTGALPSAFFPLLFPCGQIWN